MCIYINATSTLGSSCRSSVHSSSDSEISGVSHWIGRRFLICILRYCFFCLICIFCRIYYLFYKMGAEKSFRGSSCLTSVSTCLVGFEETFVRLAERVSTILDAPTYSTSLELGCSISSKTEVAAMVGG